MQCCVHVNCQEDAIKHQCAKKVVSDSLGPVDFAIGLVNSVINLLDRQMKFFWGIQITEELWNQTGLQNVFGASWNDAWARPNGNL